MNFLSKKLLPFILYISFGHCISAASLSVENPPSSTKQSVHLFKQPSLYEEPPNPTLFECVRNGAVYWVFYTKRAGLLLSIYKITGESRKKDFQLTAEKVGYGIATIAVFTAAGYAVGAGIGTLTGSMRYAGLKIANAYRTLTTPDTARAPRLDENNSAHNNKQCGSSNLI